MTTELPAVHLPEQARPLELSAQPPAEHQHDFTPVRQDARGADELAAARHRLHALADRSLHQWLLDPAQAQILIRGLSSKDVPDYVQIIVLDAVEDEYGRPLTSLEERGAFAKRISFGLNADTASAGIDYRTYANTAASSFTPETYLRYGSTLLGLTPQQTLYMLNTKTNEIHSGTFNSFLWGSDIQQERIWVFNHDEFDVDTLPLPSLHRYRKEREITLWGRKFHVTEDNGNSVVVAEGGFCVPKGVVESQNAYSRLEKAGAVTRTLSELAAIAKINAQLGVIMVLQLGQIHPAMVAGQIMWVVEPNAIIDHSTEDEIETPHHFGHENKYSRALTKWKAAHPERRFITHEEMVVIVRECGGSQPDQPFPIVGVEGLRLRAVDHHRLNGAQNAGVALPIRTHQGTIDVR
ncbi:hypothetical protein KBB12_00625 [Candidatus Woesebacteria bacterium]|nr:hypothetical protein [Candidatus Woesebacteria bacterium]